MKIKRSNKNKKIIFASLAITALLVTSYTTFAYINHLWPFLQKNEITTESERSAHSNEEAKKDPDILNEKQAEQKDQIDNEKTPPATEQPADNTPGDNPSSNNSSYINPPLLNPPSQNDPYPIENERYRIAQNSPTNFDVTLYPVVNSAEYSNYKAQLKAYKDEVLDYLRKRHGDTNKLSIQWRPSDAQNL